MEIAMTGTQGLIAGAAPLAQARVTKIVIDMTVAQVFGGATFGDVGLHATLAKTTY